MSLLVFVVGSSMSIKFACFQVFGQWHREERQYVLRIVDGMLRRHLLFCSEERWMTHIQNCDFMVSSHFYFVSVWSFSFLLCLLSPHPFIPALKTYTCSVGVNLKQSPFPPHFHSSYTRLILTLYLNSSWLTLQPENKGARIYGNQSYRYLNLVLQNFIS